MAEVKPNEKGEEMTTEKHLKTARNHFIKLGLSTHQIDEALFVLASNQNAPEPKDAIQYKIDWFIEIPTRVLDWMKFITILK